jgi:hypothetical protein
MATNKYISLKDSVNYKNKKFRVMFEGYLKSLSKNTQVNIGINGGLDVSMGAIYQERRMQIRLRHTEPSSDYGGLSDLEYFYLLNDPNPTTGSPSNVITFTDHYNNVANVILSGKLDINTLTTVLEGNYAWFIAPITLLYLESEA